MRMVAMVTETLLRVSACLLLSAYWTSVCLGQEAKVTQVAGVDNTRMGPYRALAQLSFLAFQRGDDATAAKLARILEATWDSGEWKNSSPSSFCNKNRTMCQPIDRALDVFIGPIMDYSKAAPDPVAEQAAYNDFLDKLRQAD